MDTMNTRATSPVTLCKGWQNGSNIRATPVDSALLTGRKHADRAARAKITSASMTGCDIPRFLSPEAAQLLEKLPFKDCTLLLMEGSISCHRVKLAEASKVLLGVSKLRPACSTRACDICMYVAASVFE